MKIKLCLLILIISLICTSVYASKYRTITDIKRDGKRAIGMSAVLKLRPTTIGTIIVTFTDGTGNYVKGYVSKIQRGYLAKLKSNKEYIISLKILAISKFGKIIFGTIVLENFISS